MARIKGVIRPLKNGQGCSECRALPQNVGKKKCCHTLEGTPFAYRKDGSTKFIDISGTLNDDNVSLSVKATEKVVSNYIQTLRDMSADLTEKQKKSIRNQLREL
jgi:hypothetical protein